MPRTAAGTRQVVRDFGTCLNFDGVDDKIDVTTVAAQNGHTTVSMSCWISILGLGGNNAGRIFDKSNNYFQVRVELGTIKIQADWSTDGDWQVAQPSSKGWHHLVITYDGSATTNDPVVYINGVSQTVTENVTPVGTRATDSTTLAIGGRTADTARGFNGFLDDVQYYSKVLSSTEVTQLFYGRVPSVSGLVGHWKFDEGSGTTATDSTGNANGTISGATYSTDVFIKPRTAAGARQRVRDFGTCLSISGGTQTVAITSIDFTGVLTMAVWFKRSGSGDQVQLFEHGTGTQKIFLRESANSNNVFARMVNAGSSANFSVGYTNAMDRQWHFLVVGRDASNVIWGSIDGAALTSSSTTLSGTFTTNIINLTSNTSAYKIDDLMMFDGQFLSTTEIQNLYYTGVPPYTPRLHYKFDEGSGTTANDSGSAGNTGTITGATYSTDVFIKPRTVVT